MTLRRFVTVLATLSLVAVCWHRVGVPGQSADPAVDRGPSDHGGHRNRASTCSCFSHEDQTRRREVEIGHLSDCVAISNSFLKAWCDATIVGKLPTDPSKITNSDTPVIYAALARAMVAKDLGICSDPTIMRFISLGSHLEDGKGACETSFKAMWSQGFFSVTDPSTGDTIEVPLN